MALVADTQPVALITGGTRGIGRAIADTLAAQGYALLLGYNSDDAAADAAKRELERAYKVPVQVQAGDVADASTCDSFFEVIRNKFGSRLTTVVHNAGLSISVTSTSQRGDAAALGGNDEVYNYYQAVYTQCFRRLVEGALACRGLRNVIALSSPGCNLLMQPQLFYEAPGQAKAAMEYLVRFYARKLAPQGIRVNCIIPGAAISTDAWSRIVQHSNMTNDMLEEQIVQATPLRRWVKPSEIGGLAGLLVSDAAALITGQFLIADGGAFLGRAEHFGGDTFSPSDLQH